MQRMQTLPFWRKAPLIARCVLVWFALAIGVAAAAPLLHPQALQGVCSASGNSNSNKFVGGAGKAQSKPASLSLDCPLCAGIGAPPPRASALFAAAPPPSLAVPMPDRSLRPLPTAVPPPARGPPAA